MYIYIHISILHLPQARKRAKSERGGRSVSEAAEGVRRDAYKTKKFLELKAPHVLTESLYLQCMSNILLNSCCRYAYFEYSYLYRKEST